MKHPKEYLSEVFNKENMTKVKNKTVKAIKYGAVFSSGTAVGVVVGVALIFYLQDLKIEN